MRGIKTTIIRKCKTIIPALGLGLVFWAAASMNNDVRAQDEDTESELLACDTIEDEAERIQCINELVQRLRSQGSTPETPAGQAPANAGGTLPEVNAPERETISTAETAPTDTFGFPERNSERERMIAEIERWETNPIGKTVFWLKNGQVWIENRSSDFRMSSDHGIAEIYVSWMGGYRMKIDGVPGFARVRRIK